MAQKKSEKRIFPVGKIQGNEFSCPLRILKLLLSLLNSSQRENLILKNRYVLIDYDIVIILTNVD